MLCNRQEFIVRSEVKVLESVIVVKFMRIEISHFLLSQQNSFTTGDITSPIYHCIKLIYKNFRKESGFVYVESEMIYGMNGKENFHLVQTNMHFQRLEGKAVNSHHG